MGTLVCSANARVRGFIKAAVEDPSSPLSSDPRLRVHISDSAQPVFDAMNSDDLWALYKRSMWCLVPPGNLHDLTYRFYDVIRFGCLPVVVSLPGLVASVPFAASVNYT